MFNKIMLFRHIVNLSTSTLACQVFDAESTTLEGLKFEVLHFCQMNRVPVQGEDKDEFKKKLTGDIGSRGSVWLVSSLRS